MSGITIGGAVDYFMAELLTPLRAADPTVSLVDGIEVEGQQSQSMVYVGKRDPGTSTAADGSHLIVTLGAGRIEEEYEIPFVVWATRPGPDMKPARDAAIALFDVVAHLLANDRALGGLTKLGRYSELSAVQFDQDVADEAGATRAAWLTFSIHIHNSYIP